jgi:hypothetical protein
MNDALHPCEAPCAEALDAIDAFAQGLQQTRALAAECRRFARAVACDAGMQQVAEALCRSIHRMATLEEGLLYPAARDALGGCSVIALAELEHATARQIVRQMQATDPRAARYGALVVALADCVERHAHLEQAELFPRVREARLDLASLGQRLNVRQQELAALA